LIRVKDVALSPFRSTRRRTEDNAMTSKRKIEANRENALKSTGPRTPEGKNAARLNATRHGLRSNEVLLPGEDADTLREFDENLRAEFQPIGELENLLVDRIIATAWKLRRLGRVETGIFIWERSSELAERAEREAREYEEEESGIAFGLIPEPEITDEEKHKEALERARRMRREQEDETATLGRTFARDADGANAFSKLSRYETATDRALHRALHELERRQAARQGGAVPAPHIVDVDVSGLPEGDQ
jgi:hypothetical protein